MEPSIFAARRRSFLETLGQGSVALFCSAPEARRNSDVSWKYRQDSDFLYLTGWEEPGSYCILSNVHDEHRFVLVVRPRDPKAEVWQGRRLGPEAAKERFGADASFEKQDLDDKLFEYLKGASTVYYPVGWNPDFDARVMRAVQRVRKEERKGITAPYRFIDPRHVLGDQRVLKSDAELTVLRRAVAISAAAHVRAMEECRPGMYEYELEALIEYEFRRAGANGFAFPTIIGSGENATFLHYVENSKRIEENDLVLVDAGAEYGYLGGDITRTYPASGKWTSPQRAVYEIVLDAQRSAIDAIRPGATVDSVHEVARRKLIEGMLSLQLLEGDVDTIIEEKKFEAYYMHRTSHWLGMDTHDSGRYFDAGVSRALEPSMVLTVEPGLYIAANSEDAPEEFRGIGVRVEDDVLVTADGRTVLSADVPKDPDELLKIVGRGSS